MVGSKGNDMRLTPESAAVLNCHISVLIFIYHQNFYNLHVFWENKPASCMFISKLIVMTRLNNKREKIKSMQMWESDVESFYFLSI